MTRKTDDEARQLLMMAVVRHRDGGRRLCEEAGAGGAKPLPPPPPTVGGTAPPPPGRRSPSWSRSSCHRAGAGRHRRVEITRRPQSRLTAASRCSSSSTARSSARAARATLQENANVLKKYCDLADHDRGPLRRARLGRIQPRARRTPRRWRRVITSCRSASRPTRVRTVSYGKEFPFDPAREDGAWRRIAARTSSSRPSESTRDNQIMKTIIAARARRSVLPPLPAARAEQARDADDGGHPHAAGAEPAAADRPSGRDRLAERIAQDASTAASTSRRRRSARRLPIRT